MEEYLWQTLLKTISTALQKGRWSRNKQSLMCRHLSRTRWSFLVNYEDYYTKTSVLIIRGHIVPSIRIFWPCILDYLLVYIMFSIVSFVLIIWKIFYIYFIIKLLMENLHYLQDFMPTKDTSCKCIIFHIHKKASWYKEERKTI